MHHFGILCPPLASHIGTAISLAKELTGRGEQVTVINIADAGGWVREASLSFHAVGAREHPLGSLARFSLESSRRNGLSQLMYGLRTALSETRMLLDEAPDALKRLGVTALLVDAGEPAGSTIAACLRIPFVTFASGLMYIRDNTVPPSTTPWKYQQGWLPRLRNGAAYEVMDAVLGSFLRTINRFRKAHRLNRLTDLNQTLSLLAQLSQQTIDFDFPYRGLPSHFHYIGRFERHNAIPICFPYEKLDRRPLVYASLGTVLSGKTWLLQRIAEACAQLPVQLVISYGSRELATRREVFPGTPLVVSFAPQMELIQRSALTICHGGLNTVLESLACGVPVITIPLATDQPAIGARVERSGAGESIACKSATSATLLVAIKRVLENPTYREQSLRLKHSLAAGGGTPRAADIILKVLATRLPR